ncbi:cytochrome P450 [Dichomitus squalens]|uniref:Cytochrome P450 n=1 Tax=Dichomitus squalens TaxID=114155 RepID=A0A4Q9NJ77_9APHY|nr:cytochrome P450 [Dichomitus squalens]TBU54589.1 cytochrome P450 [Dichomitus squalens]
MVESISGAALPFDWGYDARLVIPLSIVLILSTLIYRLSPVHPLCKFPGPLWRRISMIGPAYSATNGRIPQDVRSLHDQYGDIVRTGPNELHIRDPTVLAALWSVPRGPGFIGTSLSRTRQPMVGIQNPDEHQRRRRPWTRGMGPVALKEYEHIIAKRGQQLMERFEENKEEVSLDQWFHYFVFDFMSDMAFGGGTELLRNGERSNPWSMLGKSLQIVVVFSRLPWLGVYGGYIPGAGRALRALQSRSSEFTAQRVKRGSTTRDLFYYLNNEDLPNVQPPPPNHLIDDGVLAIVGGTDTTAITLTNLFYFLLTHPDVYTALQGEVDKFYPPEEDGFNPKYHRDMTYLQAVINETLRVFPPNPMGGQRQVLPNGPPVIVNNLHIPPGTVIWLSPYTYHRDPRSFTLPDTFWPERWLIASGHTKLEDARLPTGSTGSHIPVEFVHNDTAFCPFGGGPIGCVGKGLALLEIRTVTCALLQKFDVRTRHGWDSQEYLKNMKTFVTSGRRPLPVTLTLR